MRLVPWFMPWFVLWFGRDAGVTLPPFIPNSSSTIAPRSDQTVPSIPDHAPADSPAESRIVYVNLSVANRCVNPDGFPRMAVLAGTQGEEHTLPGPIISGYKGDRFLINVTNDLTDTSMFTGTTIHWHGIHQHHSSKMDGVAFVTQCPIAPKQSFLYNFTGGDQAGTFWYHSHYGTQYCDGLRGVFVIRDRQDPYKELYDIDDDSTIITLMDWYHYPSTEQIWPDSVLINGTGCYQPDLNNKNCSPPPTYTVEAKKRYRFRLLNMACRAYYNFAIDGHNMTVIEVDGEYVEPYTVNAIQIHPGQRYSFILNADQPVANYWMRAIPDPSWLFNATTTAILRYIDAPNVDPKTNSVMDNYLNETLLRLLQEPPARILQPDPDVKLAVEMYGDDKDKLFLINGASYTPPSVPILLQIMNGVLSWQIDPRNSVYLLPKDQVIEVTFHLNNAPELPHPFHLHGHNFTVIKSADGESRNYDKPVMRDTVNTGIGGKTDNVTIRFITDNPGPWLLHCHNDWHFLRGMSIVFVESYPSILAERPLDDTTLDLCPYDNPKENFTFALPPLPTTGSDMPNPCAVRGV